MITQQKLNALFRYNNGFLYWRKNGKIAGWYDNGYARVQILGKPYLIHRLVFLMFYGYMPKLIDHIDNDPSNNKIENLREATRHQNGTNAKTWSNNISGAKNVSWHKQCKKWRVRVSINKKMETIGLFDDFDLAELVAVEARNKFHGNFARHF